MRTLAGRAVGRGLGLRRARCGRHGAGERTVRGRGGARSGVGRRVGDGLGHLRLDAVGCELNALELLFQERDGLGLVEVLGLLGGDAGDVTFARHVRFSKARTVLLSPSAGEALAAILTTVGRLPGALRRAGRRRCRRGRRLLLATLEQRVAEAGRFVSARRRETVVHAARGGDTRTMGAP